ncbi:MAG: PAS domain S-box protein, partial [Nitrospirota bacterium]
MKKKIIIGLSIFSLVFLLGGIYIITTIESSTATLDNLIKLHQVEILREQLLIQIKRVQSDLNLKNTRFARSIDTVIINVENMEAMSDTCFECHHSADMMNRLKDLKNEVKKYKDSLSRVFTISANTRRLEAEEDNAFEIGEQLITKVNNMISMASIKLESKTQASLSEIANTKTVLYMLIAIVPLLAAGLGFIYIRGFTEPVNVLLKATRRLESGDLDYKIDGLKDEYGEVAISFNEMSNSLKQSMHKIEESEKRYRMLFESAGDAIFIMESEGSNAGKIISANQAAAEMHGYTINELLELNMIKDLDTSEASMGAPDRMKRILKREWVKEEIAHRKKDGTVFPVEVSAGIFEFMDHKYILAFDRDITERKKMENQILQSKLDWEDTFNTITDMITIHDSDFNIIRSNRAAKKILGLPFLEIRDAKCYKYYHGKDHPP